MTLPERNPAARYLDPLDVVWFATARRLGMTVRRAADVFASWDGEAVLTLGARDTLDADDCAAQMVLHEICHWLANGSGSRTRRDWGFCPDDDAHWREHGALRLQAALLDPWGLRPLLGPTTNFRAYWDRLGPDLSAPVPDVPDEDRAMACAADALARAAAPPFAGPLHEALSATARIQSVIEEFLPTYSSDLDSDLPGLWVVAAQRRP